MFESQLCENEYRRHCKVVIDNNGTTEETIAQVRTIIENEGEIPMDNAEQNANQFVFGLDIGTRNVVGTVGYREGKDFYVAAQYMKEHETRAMLDGQIHDIGRVGRTIAEVKAELEGQLEAKLTDVCIAAAGRVLKP